jgi:pantothenate kinase type III
MQGLVTLDLGNTHPHAGIFLRDGKSWDLLEVVPLAGLQAALKARGLNPGNSSLVAAQVKPWDELIHPLLQEGYLITWVRDYWRGQRFAGMPVNYAQTLGEDRLISAWYLYRQKEIPCLLLDAGTFLTMDVVTETGFMGGFIVPGLTTYFASFRGAFQLKDYDLQADVSGGLPGASSEAMARGYTAFGALARELLQEHNIRKLMLTGGGSDYWQLFFRSEAPSLVVETRPHLIHSALLHWMTTQIEPL